MSLIEQAVSMLAALEPDYLTVHEERCVAVRNRHASCLRCVEACTSGVLKVGEDGGIAVDASRCIGCGTCATACPTSAIEIHAPSDAQLVEGLKRSIRRTQGHPVIACEAACANAGGKGRSADGEAALAVPCLGRIDEALLAGAAAYGCFDVTLVRHDCAHCAHKTGGSMCERVVESARGLLAGFGSAMTIELAAALPERAMAQEGAPARPVAAESRRTAMRDAADRMAGAAGQVPGDNPEEGADPAPVRYHKVEGFGGTLPHHLPARRTMLFNYLNHVGEPTQDAITSRVVGNVEIDTGACSACRMCAVFCPTGALFRVDEDGAYGLAHRSAACMQCRLCESICPQQAIHVSDTVPAGQFIGKKVVYYEMPRPTWQPNQPDSMYNKVHSLIGEDLLTTMF